MERFVDKVAVVTGASSGIGASIVVKLVQKGVRVVGFARRKEKVDELTKKLEGSKGKLYGVKVDVSKENEVIEGFKWVKRNVGPVHILVNNAGILKNNDLIDGDSQQWKEILDTNIFGLCVATREAVNDMRSNNVHGHIIHINSIAGHKVSDIPKMNVYPASKHAVTALAETLRYEFLKNGIKIKITSLSPGYVETEIFDSAHISLEGGPLNNAPALKPEDIADGVLYVLSTPPHVQVQELTLKPVGEPF